MVVLRIQTNPNGAQRKGADDDNEHYEEESSGQRIPMTIIVRSHFSSSAESAERGSTKDMPLDFIHRTPWGTSTRWAVHLPAGPHLRSFKECLRSTLVAGRVVGRSWRRHTEAASAEQIQSRSNGRRALIPKMGKVQMKCLPARNNKVRRVDLVWPQAVTWQSPARLVRLAKKKNPRFHTTCPIYPVVSEEPPAVLAESAALPPAKKKRLRTKTSEAASASATSPTSPPRSHAAASCIAAPFASCCPVLASFFVELEVVEHEQTLAEWQRL